MSFRSRKADTLLMLIRTLLVLAFPRVFSSVSSQDEYSLPLRDVFTDFDRAVGSYRYGVEYAHP